jgi:biopolymer transport protein ExbD
MKLLIATLLTTAILGIKAQNHIDYELSVENCIKDTYDSIGLDIDFEFGIFQDTLISQGILKDKGTIALYALFDTILSSGYERYFHPYHIDKLEENYSLFNRCFFQFKSDTASAFKETKLYDLNSAVERIDSNPYIHIYEVINDIKRVLSAEDLNSNIYKYYTLYSFYFFVTPFQITTNIPIPKSDTDIRDKQTISVSIDKNQSFYINGKKTKSGKIESEIETIVGDNSDDYVIVVIPDKKTVISNIVLIMDIARKKEIKMTIGTRDK